VLQMKSIRANWKKQPFNLLINSMRVRNSLYLMPH
jgi:hypothetical protein